MPRQLHTTENMRKPFFLSSLLQKEPLYIGHESRRRVPFPEGTCEQQYIGHEGRVRVPFPEGTCKHQYIGHASRKSVPFPEGTCKHQCIGHASRDSRESTATSHRHIVCLQEDACDGGGTHARSHGPWQWTVVRSRPPGVETSPHRIVTSSACRKYIFIGGGTRSRSHGRWQVIVVCSRRRVFRHGHIASSHRLPARGMLSLVGVPVLEATAFGR
jgi:hypothetical protein